MEIKLAFLKPFMKPLHDGVAIYITYKTRGKDRNHAWFHKERLMLKAMSAYKLVEKPVIHVSAKLL